MAVDIVVAVVARSVVGTFAKAAVQQLARIVAIIIAQEAATLM